MLFVLLDCLFRLVEVARKGLDAGVVLLLLIGGTPGFISVPLPKAFSSISDIFYCSCDHAVLSSSRN